MGTGPSRRRARGRVAFVDGLTDILLIAALAAFARAAVALTLIPPKDLDDSFQEDAREAVDADAVAAELEL